MILKWKKFHISSEAFTSEYIIVNHFNETCSKTYPDIGQLSCLRGVLKLRRDDREYNIKVYIPAFLIVFMCFGGFWIPIDVDVGGRTGLAITALLALITMGISISSGLSISYLTAINVYMVICIAAVSLTIVELVIVIKLNKMRQKMQLAREEERKAMLESEETPRVRPVQPTSRLWTWFEQRSPNKIDNISKWVFPSTFTLVTVVYHVVARI